MTFHASLERQEIIKRKNLRIVLLGSSAGMQDQGVCCGRGKHWSFLMVTAKVKKISPNMSVYLDPKNVYLI